MFVFSTFTVAACGPSPADVDRSAAMARALSVAAAGEVVPGEVIIKTKLNAKLADLDDLTNGARAKWVRDLATVKDGTIRLLQIEGDLADSLKVLNEHPGVVYAEPSYVVKLDAVPNDPRLPEQWALRNFGQTLRGGTGVFGADIGADVAWSITTGSSDEVVGIIDTGLDYTHPDLAANVWNNPGGIGGCPAGTHGYNAVANSCDPLDDNNHGTHCAGSIGAVGNEGLGVTGINWSVRIMGLKFLNSQGRGSTAASIASINFALTARNAGVNIRVLSNSWGGGAYSQAVSDMISAANDADILFVVAAGNNRSNNDVTPVYPGSYGIPNEIVVASTTAGDGLSSFSNYGPNSVDLGAPGSSILSTIRNGYGWMSGTSMAAPFVSGAAALIRASNPSMNVSQLHDAIVYNTDYVPALGSTTISGGRLNVCRAMGCDPSVGLTADFAPFPTPASRTVSRGQSTTFSIPITQLSGFSSQVDFSTLGLPSGAGAQFNPVSTSGSSTSLTVTTAGSTPAGNYTVRIVGTSGGVSRWGSVTLTVR